MLVAEGFIEPEAQQLGMAVKTQKGKKFPGQSGRIRLWSNISSWSAADRRLASPVITSKAAICNGLRKLD